MPLEPGTYPGRLQHYITAFPQVSGFRMMGFFKGESPHSASGLATVNGSLVGVNKRGNKTDEESHPKWYK